MYENWQFITSRLIDFIDEKTGAPVKGTQVFLCRPSKLAGWQGVEVGKFFIRFDSEVLSKPLPKPGANVQIGFNRFGKISYLEEV